MTRTRRVIEKMAAEHSDDKHDRIDMNVRKTVAFAALRRIQGHVSEAQQDERLERKALLIAAGFFAVNYC